MGEADQLDALLAEQIAYYRALARAGDYGKVAAPDLPLSELEGARDEMLAALERFLPGGDVLELACGPGSWTPELLRYADTVTAVDSSPEMLAIAQERVGRERVRFLRADVFSWEPPTRYDVVFFGFLLSHVPLERFEQFWSLVGRCLKPDGRFAFVDDAYRTEEELIEDDDSSTIRRRLRDGSEFRIVKVPHTPESLKRAIEELGWRVRLEVWEPFFFGQGN
jgi:demethylmenaquinone methyltransferase/2-methoxy-6-polyprenyl-1,4-benzoquinol methylase